MIQISEAFAIALHSMIYLANKENEIVSLKEISEKFQISDNHLSKVLQRMVKAGYLTSVKGPKGGFKIVSSKKNASFMEIYEIIEGKTEPKSCLFSSKSKDCPNCVMGSLVHKINKEFKDYMYSHKISDMSL